MEKNPIAASLQALARDDKLRSKAARFREVYDEVERTLAAGVPRAAVLTTLAAQGLPYTPKGLDSALRRNRMRRRLPAADLGAFPQLTAVAADPALETLPDAAPVQLPPVLEKIMRSQPDLLALAKLAPRKPR